MYVLRAGDRRGGGGGHTREGKPQALRYGYPMPAKTV